MGKLKHELQDLIARDVGGCSLEHLQNLNGVWFWDLEHPEHQYMSDKFWTTLGHDPDTKQHLSSEWQTIVHEDDLKRAIKNFNLHCADPSHPYDQIMRFTHKKGHTVWMRARGHAIRDDNGSPVRMFGTHVDITDLKLNEIKLQKTLKNRDKFFARMSHEIRTPLHGIIGIADILKEKISDPTLKYYVETITDCSSQLKTLLDDLLTVSMIEEDVLSSSIEPVNLRAVIHFVADLYLVKAQQKGLAFKIDAPVNFASINIFTDKNRLTQILSNLLNNSIKYTDSGGINIKISIINDEVKIQIIDTGKGINNTQKVLEEYEQENESTHSEIGTGLGLNIVTRLCDQLHHEFTLESDPGKGTTASIYCQITQERELSIIENSSETIAKMERILIVDDNHVNVEIAKTMVEDLADAIDIAENGLDAVEMVEKSKDYDVILMDLHMPKKNGFDATQEIMDIQSLVKVPRIYAVTADAYESTILKCMEVGMSGHITKPFTERKLKKILEMQHSVDYIAIE